MIAPHAARLFAETVFGTTSFLDLTLDDQQSVVDWAIPQGMAALLYHHLKKQGIDEDEFPFGQPIREQSQVQTVQYLWRMHAIREVVGAFTEAGVPLIFLKGFSLAHQAYELPHLRYMCDIDAWVQGKDREQALAIMKKLGFFLCATPRITYENPLWIKYGHCYNFHRNGVDIDLRDMIYDTRGLIKLTNEQNAWLFQHHQIAKLKNGQEILVLQPELELLYASAHAFYHHVAEPTFKSLADVALLCHNIELDWDLVLTAMDRLGWQEGLFYMLQSTIEYFPLKIPESVWHRLRIGIEDDNPQRFLRRLRQRYTLANELRSVEPNDRIRFVWNSYLFPDKEYIDENYPVHKPWQLPWYYLVYFLSRLAPFFGIILRLRDR